jgi:serine/threonine protein kinase, bacterial
MRPFWGTSSEGSVAGVSGLLSASAMTDDPARYVAQHATVVATFDHHTQDSGNVSWLVDTGGRRLFVKTAGADAPPIPNAPVPYFGHAGRVDLLRNAVELARSVTHRALPRLLNVRESPWGPVLVYQAAPGESVGVPRAQRSDPGSAYQRLARLPADQLLPIFDDLIDLHAALAAHGWIAGDLYDGCLIVDFATGRLSVVDLDSYRRGPSRNDMGRMFGSTRFMAPEEFELGAPIDQRTTVFTLGRLAWHFGTRLTERGEDFCGPRALGEVVQWACRPAPSARPATVAAWAEAWRNVRSEKE